MLLSPVIQRDLREESRRAPTYWMRVCAGVLATLALVVAMWDQQLPAQLLGARLFFLLNFLFFLAIWVFVPMFTADCLSRELREGTMPLLFLTPLTPSSVVIGKGISQMLRALGMFLAILPVLTIPFVLGGVSAEQVIRAVCMNLGSLLLALGCGLIGSSRSRVAVRSMALSAGLGMAMMLAVLLVNGVAMMYAVQAAGNPAIFMNTPVPPGTVWPVVRAYLGYLLDMPVFDLMQQLVWFATGYGDVFGVYSIGQFVWGPAPGPAARTAAAAKLAVGMSVPVVSLLVLWVAVRYAAWEVSRRWKQGVTDPRKERVVRAFTTPVVLRGVLRSRMRGQLNRNPVGWLQLRTWTARSTKWGWTLLIVVAESLSVSLDPSLRLVMPGQFFLSGVVMISLAFASAASFRQEVENGAFELILVTPIREGQVIWGRVRGLLWQFAPSVALLLLVHAYMHIQLTGWGRYLGQGNPYSYPVGLLGTYLTLPFVGLWCSMRQWNPLQGSFITVMLGLIAPIAVAQLIHGVLILLFGPSLGLWDPSAGNAPVVETFGMVQGVSTSILLVVVQSVVVGWAYRGLVGALKARRFLVRTAS